MYPLLATLLWLAPASASPAAAPADVRAKVDAVFREYDRTDSPGCALGVYRDGKIAFERGYGMANLELGIANSPQSVFDIGSTSKQFTAFSIHLLAREGKLSLDDDIRKWLPEVPSYGKTVTIRHLLHHTSGLRDYIEVMALQGMQEEDWTTEADALGAIARQKAPNFGPGDDYLYSNSGFFLLGVIVKRASGQSLRDFAQARIFGPLGMRHTQFNDWHNRILQERRRGIRHRYGQLGAGRRRGGADDGRGSADLGPELLRTQGRRPRPPRRDAHGRSPQQRQEALLCLGARSRNASRSADGVARRRVGRIPGAAPSLPAAALRGGLPLQPGGGESDRARIRRRR